MGKNLTVVGVVALGLVATILVIFLMDVLPEPSTKKSQTDIEKGVVADKANEVSKFRTKAINLCYKLAYFYAEDDQWVEIRLKSGKNSSKTLPEILSNVRQCNGKPSRNPRERIEKIIRLVSLLERAEDDKFEDVKTDLQRELAEIDEKLDLIFVRVLLQMAEKWPQISYKPKDLGRMSEADAMRLLLVLHDRSFPDSLKKQFDERPDFKLERLP